MRVFKITVVVSLLGALALGVGLRWWLAGTPLSVLGRFEDLRHAHSHLGYYGVLFPLMWAAWQRRGLPVLPAWAQWAYLVAVLVSVFGFARAGYGIEAIVGSTAVLIGWLASSWRIKACAVSARDWLASAPPGVLLAAFCIPPIAVFTRRDPQLAAQIVQSFLSLVLFAVAVPTALDRLGLPAPRSPLWLVGALLGALAVGVWPHPAAGLGLVLMGLIIFWSFRRAALPLDLQAMWAIFGLSLAGLGTGLIPNVHATAIAGLHFIILGPLLMSFAHTLAPTPAPVWLRAPYIVGVLTMSGAITAALIWPAAPHTMLIAALAGSLASLSAVIFLLWSWRRPTEV